MLRNLIIGLFNTHNSVCLNIDLEQFPSLFHDDNQTRTGEGKRNGAESIRSGFSITCWWFSEIWGGCILGHPLSILSISRYTRTQTKLSQSAGVTAVAGCCCCYCYFTVLFSHLY